MLSLTIETQKINHSPLQARHLAQRTLAPPPLPLLVQVPGLLVAQVLVVAQVLASLQKTDGTSQWLCRHHRLSLPAPQQQRRWEQRSTSTCGGFVCSLFGHRTGSAQPPFSRVKGKHEGLTFCLSRASPKGGDTLAFAHPPKACVMQCVLQGSLLLVPSRSVRR